MCRCSHTGAPVKSAWADGGWARGGRALPWPRPPGPARRPQAFGRAGRVQIQVAYDEAAGRIIAISAIDNLT
ncbi:hypothetical protein ACWD6S_09190, partial [Streptomyces zhihengii]